MHTVDDDAPVLAEYVPAAQFVHTDELEDAE